MIHKLCEHCKQIGHKPEMNLYIKPKYCSFEFKYIKKWGLRWYHDKCYIEEAKNYFENITLAVKEIKEATK